MMVGSSYQSRAAGLMVLVGRCWLGSVHRTGPRGRVCRARHTRDRPCFGLKDGQVVRSMPRRQASRSCPYGSAQAKAYLQGALADSLPTRRKTPGLLIARSRSARDMHHQPAAPNSLSRMPHSQSCSKSGVDHPSSRDSRATLMIICLTGPASLDTPAVLRERAAAGR